MNTWCIRAVWTAWGKFHGWNFDELNSVIYCIHKFFLIRKPSEYLTCNIILATRYAFRNGRQEKNLNSICLRELLEATVPTQRMNLYEGEENPATNSPLRYWSCSKKNQTRRAVCAVWVRVLESPPVVTVDRCRPEKWRAACHLAQTVFSGQAAHTSVLPNAVLLQVIPARIPPAYRFTLGIQKTSSKKFF